LINSGLAAFKLQFQISPIVLTGGLAGGIPGGMLPLISITEAQNFAGLLSGGSSDLDLDEFFAFFQPLPGGTLIDQQIGHYPFANQAVAANAVIAQPLKISMLMIVPAQGPAAYAVKLATLMSLQAAIKQHNASGGTYTVVTPAAFYANCVMTGLVDISNQRSKKVQNAWRWDFEQPLLTVADAQQQQNSMMSKLTAGVQTDGSLSGLEPTVGSPFSLAAPSLIPAASGLPAAGTAVAPGSGGTFTP